MAANRKQSDSAPDSESQPGPTNAPTQQRTQSGSSDEVGGQSYDYGQPSDLDPNDLYRTPEEGEGGTSFDYGEPLEPPASSDLKEEWVDHAVAKGMDREEAESTKKADLVEKFGEDDEA